MTNRTAGRQRFRPTVHTKSPARDQGALLVAATRRGPASVCTAQDAPHQEAIAMGVPVPRREVASHLTDRVEREIRFDDLPPENPDLLDADPRHAVPVELLAVEPSPLRAGHEHAGSVLAEMRTETAALKPRGEHMTHHQQPKSWLRTVPLVDPVAALCDSVELAIARFACAVSDLALKPGGAHALRMLLAAHAGRPVTAYDHRPIGVAVGRELNEVAA